MRLPLSWFSFTLPKRKAKNNIYASLTQLIYERQFSSRFDPKAAPITLPPYKYFTSLVENLLRLCAQYGGPLFGPLSEIRRALAQDLQFEEKYGRESRAGLGQMLLLLLMVWFFIFCASQLTDLHFPWHMYLIIALLHTLGMLTFIHLQKKIKLRLFHGLGSYFSAFYSCKALLASGAPLNLAIKEARLESLFEDQNPQYLALRVGLKNALERLQSKGSPIQDELELLIAELLFLQEQAYQQFGRKFLALRLTVMSLFFLGSYLYFMASLVGCLLQKL